MQNIKAASLVYQMTDEHLLRRLGGAVVVQWPSLPQEVRSRLIQQATLMADRDNAAGLDYQIKRFIETRQE